MVDQGKSRPFDEGMLTWSACVLVPDLRFVIQDVKLDLRPILSAADIPMAVHGTTRQAWESIGRNIATCYTYAQLSQLLRGFPG